MHVALRTPKDKKLFVDGEDVIPGVHSVLERISRFSDRVRGGEWVGATGKALRSVLCIGIGGSFLGPEFAFEALRTDSLAAKAAEGRSLAFLANVDPVDVARALSGGLDPETTLVIVVSKTFTTAETMLNARTIKKWLLEGVRGPSSEAVIRQHMVAVSSATPKAVAFGISQDNVFGFWDWVGGRFSVSSAVGVLPLALQYGFPVVQQFLAGAHDMDTVSALRSYSHFFFYLFYISVYYSTFSRRHFVLTCQCFLVFSESGIVLSWATLRK
jgi:glucose-6-phosphate isomerase